METQRGLLRRPTPLTGWGVSIAAPKGMRRAPRRVRLRVISNGGVAPKPPYGAAASAAARGTRPRPPMGGGGRLAALVRPSRRTLCFLRSLGRSDEHAREKRPRLPGRPARRVGPLLAQQRHFSGYSFGAKRVPLRRLFVIAPFGALSSFEDRTCEDKRYPPAVSHSLRSKRDADLLNKPSKKAQHLPSSKAHRQPPAASLHAR